MGIRKLPQRGALFSFASLGFRRFASARCTFLEAPRGPGPPLVAPGGSGRLSPSFGIEWQPWASNCIHWHLLASSGIDWHRLASNGINWHRLTSIGIHWHRWASTGIYWHRLVSSGIHWHPLIFMAIDWISVGIKWLPFASSCILLPLLGLIGIH